MVAEQLRTWAITPPLKDCSLLINTSRDRSVSELWWNWSKSPSKGIGTLAKHFRNSLSARTQTKLNINSLERICDLFLNTLRTHSVPEHPRNSAQIPSEDVPALDKSFESFLSVQTLMKLSKNYRLTFRSGNKLMKSSNVTENIKFIRGVSKSW